MGLKLMVFGSKSSILPLTKFRVCCLTRFKLNSSVTLFNSRLFNLTSLGIFKKLTYRVFYDIFTLFYLLPSVFACQLYFANQLATLVQPTPNTKKKKIPDSKA